MSGNRTSESREDALERILAETAKNPYTPKTPVRPNRTAAKPVVKTIPSAEKSEVALSFEKRPEPVKKPVLTKSETKPSQKFREDNGNLSAAEKIAAIKRARQQAGEAAADAVQNPTEKPLEEKKQAVKRVEEKVYDIYESDDIFEDDYDSISGDRITFDDVLGLVEKALAVILCVLLIYTYIIRVAEVDGESMAPTLSDGEKLIVRSIMYTPECGDVVVIDNDKAHLLSEDGRVLETEGLDKMIVKRIIAVGGQTVDINFETGEVKVDGKVLEEKYISEPTTRDEFAFKYPLKVPEGYAFVMGDNRNISMDSRHISIGLVSEDDILGKVAMRIYPFGKLGFIE